MRPAEFLSAIEETGLIIPLGWWLINEACHQLRQWQLQMSDEHTLGIGPENADSLAVAQVLNHCPVLIITSLDDAESSIASLKRERSITLRNQLGM